MKKTLIFSVLFSSISYTQIPTMVTGKNIKLYTDSQATERMGYGNWNPHEDGEALMIRTFIKKGDTVIDAGAHVGDWSDLVLQHTSHQCTLYSFEPVPYFFQKLNARLGAHLTGINSAVGSTETELLMNYYYVESEGCSSLYDRKVLSSIPVKKIKVPVISLDTFCTKHTIDHINFLKIDTEGAEWQVLQGADRLITAKKIPFIQFEYGGTYPDANITLKQVYNYLTSKEYDIFRITADGLIHIPQWRNALENYHLSNYLAVLRDHPSSY